MEDGQPDHGSAGHQGRALHAGKSAAFLNRPFARGGSGGMTYLPKRPGRSTRAIAEYRGLLRSMVRA